MRMMVYWTMSVMLFSLGCGGSNAEETITGEMIKAKEGGIVVLEGSQSSVNIPAESMAEDTLISLTLTRLDALPALESARAEVLKIEPAGLTLEMPAAVTLEIGEPIKPEEEEISVMMLVKDSWQALEGAQVVSGGLVSVPITTLGTLALVVKKRLTPVVPAGNMIKGQMIWGDESPVSDTPLYLYQGETKLTEKTTDADGKFTFSDLTPGSYTIKTGDMAECPVEEVVQVTNEKPTVVTLVMCGG